MKLRNVRAAIIAGVACLAARTAAAQGGGADSVTVVAGPEYHARGLNALLFGTGYQELWRTSLRVAKLDLRTFAGGLTPTKKGGGKQTQSLRFRGADGKEYAFRSVHKELNVLPPELRRVLAGRIIQGQLKSAHPAGPLVVPPLLKAAGLLHTDPRLYVMPDDPRLGQFRAEFAGMLGMLEERPNETEDGGEAFAGAVRVIGTDRLFERLEKSPDDRVDAREYLDARLMDLLVGDWDRHVDQWRWAQLVEGTPRVWHPIPQDRDQAFSNFGGVFIALVRQRFPRVVRFGPEYHDLEGLTASARPLDRRLLAELERPAWDSAVMRMQGVLTDAVIDDAVSRLPPEYRTKNAAWMARALRGRRDRLGFAAHELYRRLAAEPDVQATDGADRADVERRADGSVAVRLSARGAGSRPYFSRVFRSGETNELRIYLHGGADTAVVRGNVGQSLKVRVIGGGGDDVLADSSRVVGGGRRTRLYDSRGHNVLVAGTEARVETRDWTAPADSGADGLVGNPWRDQGSRTYLIPWVGYRSDLGPVLGAGFEHFEFGFRQVPFSQHHVVRAAVATGARTGAAEWRGTFRRPMSSVALDVHALASGMELTRFHGFGNDVPLLGDENLYRNPRREALLEAAWSHPVAPGLSFAVGPRVLWADTRPRAGSFLDSTRPYGVGRFAQAGGLAQLTLDRRDQVGFPTRGVFAGLGGTAYPAALDVRSVFGEAHASAATYLSARLPLQPVLGLYAGGKRVWGTFPYHEAAFVGGGETVRGYREQRFAGDAAAWGSAELRLFITRFGFVIPGRLGVLGLTDAGRVWLHGASPGGWHTSAGGGVWIQAMDEKGPAFTITAARGEETRIYAGAGFHF
ncbi:MAG: hypothetical protein JWM27_3541 [Gemmatimonadetes bacterium]|nr:hypothetical protein [Gemmatimonadota bacterium]